MLKKSRKIGKNPRKMHFFIIKPIFLEKLALFEEKKFLVQKNFFWKKVEKSRKKGKKTPKNAFFRHKTYFS